MKIGHSYDLHNLIVGKEIILGGIRVPCEFAIEAISDGDVIFHAISEAILGALGLGDLGDFFDKHNATNLSSTIILKTVLKKMRTKAYKINNLDLTVVLDQPLLKNYKKLIKENLVNLLNLDFENINVKATTTENNFSNIIQVYAVILLLKE